MSTIIINQRTLISYSAFHDALVYDQRDMPRWKINKRAFYRIDGTATIAKTETIDFNVEGACFYVAADVHPSQQLDIKVYLSDKVSFETAGIVIWKRSRSNGHFFAGVLFDKLSDESQEMILEYAFDNKGLLDVHPMA